MGAFSNLKVALISDNLTETSLKGECKLINITPLNYKVILKFWKPDLLITESCWEGKRKSWKYKIASYPDYPKRNNKKLNQVVEYAKKLNIPTVFWNKEDGIHFERFIESAKLFEYIFTTDSNMIDSYKQQCKKAKSIDHLTFAVNPKIHYPKNIDRINKVCFLGSYYKNQHEKRAEFQNMAFESLLVNGLDIYDRNYSRRNKNFNFPKKYKSHIHKGVKNEKTADIYSKYLASLNVNTVTNSPTMFSRRILEAMACKSLVITNNSSAIEQYFKDCVIVINDKNDFQLIKEIISNPQLAKLKIDKAYNIVLNNFTIERWLGKIISKLK